MRPPSRATPRGLRPRTGSSSTRTRQGQINRNIYGQFSEHLGRCIYDGIWVGEDSPIPNTRGIRNDVVAALKKIQVPGAALAGRLFCRRVSLEGRHRPAQRNGPPMINTHWGGVVENNHFGTHEFLDLCEQTRLRALHLRQRRQRHACRR